MTFLDDCGTSIYILMVALFPSAGWSLSFLPAISGKSFLYLHNEKKKDKMKMIERPYPLIISFVQSLIGLSRMVFENVSLRDFLSLIKLFRLISSQSLNFHVEPRWSGSCILLCLFEIVAIKILFVY